MMANTEPEEEKNKVKTIRDLDDDCLLIIFSLLNIYGRTQCERVCQRWNNLIMHSWAATKSLVFRGAFNRCKYRESLDLHTFHNILKKCPNLQSIDFSQAIDFNEKYCEIGKCCSELGKLILRGTNPSAKTVTMIGKMCPKLKYIDLSYCVNISEKSLWELFESRPDLEYITLNLAQYITGKCFYLLNALSHLDLSGCLSICTEAFSQLGQNCSQSLKTLYAPRINSESFKIICMTFPNLKVLKVKSSSEALHGSRFLRNLTKLQMLRFFVELQDLDDGAFLSIMKNFPDLRVLILCDNYKLTDLSVVSLPKYCKNLRILSLKNSQISDDSARALAHLKKLTQLNIDKSLITDEGAMHILSHSTSLELLSINECSEIRVKTILYAWDLVNQGLVSKDLLIRYYFKEIKVNELATREECEKFFETEKYDYHDFDEDEFGPFL